VVGEEGMGRAKGKTQGREEEVKSRGGRRR